MIKSDEGFTMMEILLTVAIVLIIGSAIVVASNTAMQGAKKAGNITETAKKMVSIDRYIRDRANEVHIPYWDNPTSYIDTFNSHLFSSQISPYINTIRVVYDRKRSPRGIEVFYTVNGREMRTLATFASIVLVDMEQ